MNKIEVNTRFNKYFAEENLTTCNCTGCGICATCAVFAPIVGAFLAPSLGVNLTGVRSV